MLTLTRRQALIFRTVLKHSLLEQEPPRQWPLVVARGTAQGLTLEAAKGDLAVRWQVAGPPQEGALAFRAAVLCELEARNDEPVLLEAGDSGKARARWHEGVMPRDWEFEAVAPDSVPAFPATPEALTAMPDSFARALAEAALVAATDNTRFALTRVQLRGKAGEVAATDGRQLLLWRGFDLPWTGDLLVPRLGALLRKGLLPLDAVELGRTDSDVALRLGPWLFLLRIDAKGRFPDVRGAIPDRQGVTCTLHLGPEDARLLAAALPRLPAAEPGHFPVTLELDAKVTVRARPQGSDHDVELALLQSRIDGKPVVVCTHRQYLLRALDLGFRAVEVCRPDMPLVCRAESRLYEWLPLPVRDATDNKTQTTPTAAEDPAIPEERRIITMPTPSNGRSRPPAPEPPSDPDNGAPGDALSEAEELRRLLAECGGRLARLASILRQQRRQTKVFRQALSSLRQFDLDG